MKRVAKKKLRLKREILHLLSESEIEWAKGGTGLVTCSCGEGTICG